MTFWLFALILTVSVVLVVVYPLVKRRSTDQAPAENLELQIYRDQLNEVESDLAKGVLSEEEAERTRLEVSRRLLDADKAHLSARAIGQAGQRFNFLVAILTGLVLLGGSGAVYWHIGAFGTPDLPLAKRDAQMADAQAARPPQAEIEAKVGDRSEMADRAEAEYKALVAQLRETAADRPNDLRGQELLANHEARLGNFAAARIAKGRAIELMAAEATANDYTDYAELMIVAAGGYVSPLAERALGAAIRLDPTNPRARYYSGLDLAQNGRPDLAYRLWSELVEEGPEDAPWIAPIRAEINNVARLAGIATTLPGPDAGQVEDAGDLNPEERQEMIRGMVAQLSARLANDGGTASEWARLIRAYGVLGELERAAAIWGEAQVVFASDDIAMAELLDAAKAAGVAK